jgi:hypothetical protein
VSVTVVGTGADGTGHGRNSGDEGSLHCERIQYRVVRKKECPLKE